MISQILQVFILANIYCAFFINGKDSITKFNKYEFND